MSRNVVRSIALVGLLVAGCTATTDTPEGGDAGLLDCRDRACDSFDPPPALGTISLASIATCSAIIDDTTDPFFAVDRIRCAVRLPAEVSAIVAYVRVAPGGGASPISTMVPEASLRSGEPFEVGRLTADQYPVALDLTLGLRVGEGSGAPGEAPMSSGGGIWWDGSRTFATRAELGAITEAAPLRMGLPFDLWQVALWPSRDLGTAWVDEDLALLLADLRSAFPTTSAPLAVGGVTATTRIEHSRRILARRTDLPSLAALARTVLTVPVPRGAEASAAPQVEVRLDRAVTTTSIAAPGYYVIDPAGALALTAPADLPALVGPPITDRSDAGRGDLSDGGPVPEIDAGPEDGGPIAPEDPCGGACGPTQACVAAICVTRADNVQALSGTSTLYCRDPTRACDAGEDRDCADGHACVAGLCRRLSCQHQELSGTSTLYCRDPRAACEGDDDCASGHACAAGLCRRLSCQHQELSGTSTLYCRDPRAVCDEDADCTSGHACVSGLCRRLTCQQQELSGTSTLYCRAAFAVCADDDDADCAAEHACAGGVCRRLSCQQQDMSSSTSCRSATAICDEGDSGDCTTGHTCRDGLCRRDSCG
jgi:hypothetical protein